MKFPPAFILSLALAASPLTLASSAWAEILHFKANLIGANEVPAKESDGHGTLTATLDTTTNELKYHVEFSGLTGPVLAAHFHGPADPGVNAKPSVPVKVSSLASSLEGSATLSADQVKDLQAGKWYFNLHTSANPSGEIRGQVKPSAD